MNLLDIKAHVVLPEYQVVIAIGNSQQDHFNFAQFYFDNIASSHPFNLNNVFRCAVCGRVFVELGRVVRLCLWKSG